MDAAAYLSFLIASCIVLAIPGPTVLLVVGVCLREGRKAALPLALGVALGDALAISLSLAGLGAILATSAALFTILKYCGAAYCVYLGVSMLRSAASASPAPELAAPPRRVVGRAFLVTALNPKSITFFVAFLPQFLNANAPIVPQALLVGASFVLLALGNALAYGLLASGCAARMQGAGAMRWMRRAGGGCLVTAGLAVALD